MALARSRARAPIGGTGEALGGGPLGAAGGGEGGDVPPLAEGKGAGKGNHAVGMLPGIADGMGSDQPLTPGGVGPVPSIRVSHVPHWTLGPGAGAGVGGVP